MAARILGVGVGLTGDIDPGENGWAEEMNLNLLTLSAGLVAASVESRTSALPVGTIPDGAMYICDAGEATGFDQYDIAIWDDVDAMWTVINPTLGLHVYVIDEAAWYWFNGTLWEPSALAGAKVATEAGTTFTPDAAEMGTYILLTHGTGCLVTLPNGIPAGREIHFEGAGAGAYTFAATGTLHVAPSRDPQISEQYGVVTAKSKGSNTWTLFGALAEAST